MVHIETKIGAGVKPTSDVERGNWSNRAEFLLSCIGLAVGIGNVWRFPYLAYQNGGGAFLVAYVILLALVGKPHFFAELAIGQFTSQGSLRIWRCFPLGKGVGVAMVTLSTVIAIYYNVIMMYTLYYMGQSFRAEVPWSDCQKWWGADDNCYVRSSNQTLCREVIIRKDIDLKDLSTCSNSTQTASEQFWERYVLQLTSGINDLGSLKWDLVGTLFVCWTIVALGLMNGIKSTGKVVYFTATFPYVILITLVIYGCTLSGAMEGLRYFFIPEWKRLLEIQVWRAAAEQVCFSLSLGSGSLVMYASYNKFDNKLYRDGVFVSILDFITSVISGVVIFSVLGHMSVEMKVDIQHVAKGGQGLAFVTYPEALANLPIPQLWSVLFFFMLFLLAIDSEFSYLENLFTVLYDEYPHLKEKKKIITVAFCFSFFLIGLPYVLQGGQYILNLVDTYGGGMATIFIATIEISTLMWGYGAENFTNDLEFMLKFRMGLYWRLCWKYLSPLTMWFVLIYSLYIHTPIQYAGKHYPAWAEYVGWFVTMVSVMQVPIWGAVQVYRYRKNLGALLRPHPEWGPLDPEIRRLYFLQKPSTICSEGVVNLVMEPIHDEMKKTPLHELPCDC